MSATARSGRKRTTTVARLYEHRLDLLRLAIVAVFIAAAYAAIGV